MPIVANSSAVAANSASSTISMRCVRTVSPMSESIVANTVGGRLMVQPEDRLPQRWNHRLGRARAHDRADEARR